MNDVAAATAIASSRNMLVPWYLMGSFMYYVMDQPIITDGLFDSICKSLLMRWPAIKHPHKGLIKREWLPAGTCALAADAFPCIVTDAALRLGGYPLEQILRLMPTPAKAGLFV